MQEAVEKPGNVIQFRADYGCAILKPDMVLNIRNAINKGWDPAKHGGPTFSVSIAEWKWATVKNRPFVKK